MAEIFRPPSQEITNVIEDVRKECETFKSEVAVAGFCSSERASFALDQIEAKIEYMGEILDFLAGELNAQAQRFNSVLGQHTEHLQRNLQSWKVHAIKNKRDYLVNVRKLRVKLNERKIFENVVQGIPSGIAVLDGRELIVKWANPTFMAMVGREDAFGKRLTELMQVNCRQEVTSLCWKALDSRQYMAEPELECRYSDERVCWRSVNIWPIFFGNSAKIIVQITDITEQVQRRKRSEAQAEKEMTQRSMLDLLMQKAPVGIGFLDKSGRYIKVNDALAMMNHVPAAEHIGRTPLEIIPDMGHILTEMIEGVLRSGETVFEENVCGVTQAEPDDFRCGLVSMYPVYGENQEILGLGVIVIDNTQRKMMERQLREREEVLNLFIERAPASIAMFDTQMRYIKASRRWMTDYNIGDIDVTGKCHYEIFPEIEERWKQIHSRCLAGVVERCEADRFERADGRVDWVKWEVRPWYKNSSEIGGLIMFTEVVTERKEAEERIKASEERFRSLVANIPGAVYRCACDSDWTMEYISDYIREISGYEPEEFINNKIRSYKSIILEEDREKVWDVVSQAINEHRPFMLEYRITAADGSIRWINERGRGMFRNTHLCGLDGVIFDITEMKNYQRRLELLRDELEGKNSELESILSAASHDLRSPLVNIKGFGSELTESVARLAREFENVTLESRLQIALKQALEDEIPESVNYIQNSAEMIDHVLCGLLRLARVGLSATKPVKLNMNSLLESVVQNAEFAAKKANAVITLEQVPWCYADESQVIQIFTNLIDNAIKYLKPGTIGEIKITGMVEKDFSVYCVEDNGQGIAPQFQKKIFELFFRATQAGKANGEGLGLTLVKRMITRNGGNIWLESKQGVGSRFFVALPS
ncbi:MAG: hypothetical protein A2Y07_04655 [Planctomycetes bacterium GWF2_50_10]|nr:MAG: hypothetical protein A2Y07_04655 [Planctomycetes bacterium GWF2_50_10]